METYDRLTELKIAVESCQDTLARLAALSVFFTACEEIFSGRKEAECDTVFHVTAFLLGSRVADSIVWDWWQEQARAATTPKRRESLRIALFELVPETPVIWSDFYRLWDFWFDPEARWAVFAAYRWFPRRLPAHLARYTAHRRRHKLPVPNFSHDEFRLWLQDARAV